jgi:hypothetical protein
MTEADLLNATEKCLKDFQLRKDLGITKHDAQNLRRNKSIPMMLEFLFRANKLKIKDESTK